MRIKPILLACCGIIIIVLRATTAHATTDDNLKTYTLQELLSLGEKNYNIFCAGCHQKDGSGMPLDAPPLRKGTFASSYITIDKPANLHIEIVLNGVPGTSMVGFGKALTPLQLAAIVTYERNAWGNATGDIIQPKEILAEQSKLVDKKETDTLKDYTLAELIQMGKANYRTYCARCHQIGGEGKAPNGPKLKGSYVASDPTLINHKIELVLEGAPGTRMRGYAKQLSATQIASILTYIGNAWSNEGKQLIQPKQIVAVENSLRAQTKNSDDTKQFTLNELMNYGAKEYMAYCARCHLPDGSGHAQPGVPSLRGSKITTGKPITNHIDIVLTGVAGSIMRTFAPRLTNHQIAAIVTYERNAWGNNTGDIVQPAFIQQERLRLQDKINYQMTHQLQQQFVVDEQREKAQQHKN